MLSQRWFLAILLLTLSVDQTRAQTPACPDDSTSPICISAAQNRALAASITALATAKAAEASANAALNKARFEFLNSDDIVPNTGAAGLEDEQKIQAWVANIASKASATVIAGKLQCAGRKFIFVDAGSGFGWQAASAERARLRSELDGLAREIGFAAAAEWSVEVFAASEVGGLVQSLAAIAGFFVTDYNLLSTDVAVKDVFLQDALIADAVRESEAKPCLFVSMSTMPADTTQIDQEMREVSEALANLGIKISATPEPKKALLTAIYEQAQKRFAAIVEKPGTGLSAYTQAAIFDAIKGCTNCRFLEITSEVNVGGLASAVKRFSSGKYVLLGASSVRFRSITLDGSIENAGTVQRICRFELPTKGLSESGSAAVACSKN